MRRRGNCGFAPPGADEARPQFPQPRRFAGRGFMPRPGNGKCGKAEVRAATRPPPRRGSNPTEVRHTNNLCPTGRGLFA